MGLFTIFAGARDGCGYCRGCLLISLRRLWPVRPCGGLGLSIIICLLPVQLRHLLPLEPARLDLPIAITGWQLFRRNLCQAHCLQNPAAIFTQREQRQERERQEQSRDSMSLPLHPAVRPGPRWVSAVRAAWRWEKVRGNRITPFRPALAAMGWSPLHTLAMETNK